MTTPNGIGPAPSRLWERSGFWPIVGTTLILAASVIRGEMLWVDGVAAALVAWGTFLGGTRRHQSVRVDRLAGYTLTPHGDAWRGQTR